MKMVHLTLIDLRSTKEHPVQPESVVVKPLDIEWITTHYLDKNHQIILSYLETNTDVLESPSSSDIDSVD